MDAIEQAAMQFRQFGEVECRGRSALYAALSLAIAADQTLLALALHGRHGQPLPNLLLAAVHQLLLDASAETTAPAQTLASYYASCTAAPRDPGEAFPVFRAFVLQHHAVLQAVIARRLVQTNEVRRSAYLYPALCYGASLFSERPLHLIEIGTSAGLNLLWDRYGYRAGAQLRYGDAQSALIIATEFRGPAPAILAAAPPPVAHRLGIDLNPIDARQPSEASWLRALIWPEHDERRRLLAQALTIRQAHALELRVDDGFAHAAALAAAVPADALPCLYHTHVANQVPAALVATFLQDLATLGRSRDLIHVCNNIWPSLHLSAYRDGVEIALPLARTDAHGSWIEWLAPER